MQQSRPRLEGRGIEGIVAMRVETSVRKVFGGGEEEAYDKQRKSSEDVGKDKEVDRHPYVQHTGDHCQDDTIQ